MKEIIETKPIEKVVITGYEKVITYETMDGAIFGVKGAAEKHEEDLKYRKKRKNIKHKKIDTLFEFVDFYYPIDEEELEMVKNIIGFYSCLNSVFIRGELKINEWITSVYKGDGDRNDDKIYIYTIPYIKEKIDEFIKELK